MAVQIKNLTVVLAGGNFPVDSVRLNEFSFRNRPFKETVRIGPTVQGTSGNATILMLPDRFQVSVPEADKVEIQSEGIREVVDSFAKMVGYRTIKHVGHNAHALFDDSGSYNAAVGQLFKQDSVVELLQPVGQVLSGATFEFQKDAQSKARVALQRTETNQLVLDFNFDFDLDLHGVTLEGAMSMLEQSIEWVNEICASFEARIAEAGATA